MKYLACFLILSAVASAADARPRQRPLPMQRPPVTIDDTVREEVPAAPVPVVHGTGPVIIDTQPRVFPIVLESRPVTSAPIINPAWYNAAPVRYSVTPSYTMPVAAPTYRYSAPTVCVGGSCR